MNTYSFKGRPDVSPRIHVLSVVGMPEETEQDQDYRQDRKQSQSHAEEVQAQADADRNISDLDGFMDSGSIITALPAIPPPTPASIPSLASEYQPQQQAVEAH